jgi:hypothetical protein
MLPQARRSRRAPMSTPGSTPPSTGGYPWGMSKPSICIASPCFPYQYDCVDDLEIGVHAVVLLHIRQVLCSVSIFVVIS